MTFLGGNIYFDKAKNGCYKWSIQSEEDIANFMQYIKICSIQSIKRNRIFLIKEYYRLVSLKAYKAEAEENSILYKSWKIFNQKWNTPLL